MDGEMNCSFHSECGVTQVVSPESSVLLPTQMVVFQPGPNGAKRPITNFIDNE